MYCLSPKEYELSQKLLKRWGFGNRIHFLCKINISASGLKKTATIGQKRTREYQHEFPKTVNYEILMVRTPRKTVTLLVGYQSID
ncbi:hypothetical protein CJP73_15910 [Neopusillimonas maritima]|uniref:Uncharacterized protein n=1 Tax=Neopusillimonas maritima TaxID=2026239 RepID=A0A3A1YMN6_9BURK|nr:hypothetical protein CJP73_15910 [Neopusillimonas maritima]